MTDDALKKVRVADLKVGDLIDLQADPYADPEDNRTVFAFEYAMVATLEHETPDCIAVGIEGVDVFGMPPDHLVPHTGTNVIDQDVRTPPCLSH